MKSLMQCVLHLHWIYQVSIQYNAGSPVLKSVEVLAVRM